MRGGGHAGQVLVMAVAVLAALPPLACLPSATAQAASCLGTDAIRGLPWWNVTDADHGLHLRALVQVTNLQPFPVTNGAVAAELDLARLLDAAGWPSTRASGQVQLKGFHLDPNSLRVVPLNDLAAPPGVCGTLKPVDQSGFLPPDPRAYEEPSAHFEGSLAGSLSMPFNADTNPYVTVVWRVSGTLAPGDKRPYMVYFDTLANGPAPPPSYNRRGAGGALQALFWSSPALTLYGTVPASAAVGTATVVGLHPGTTVSVWSAPASGPTAGLFSRVRQPPGFPQPPSPGAPEGTFAVGQEDSQQVFIANSEARVFRLEADRPILGFGLSTGFVPSTSGTLLGTDFVFALTQPAMWEQDTIYFIDPTGTPLQTTATTVEVQRMEDGRASGSPFSFFIGSQGNPWPYTRGARAGGFSDGGSMGCQPTNRPGLAPLLPLPPGPGVYHARVQPGGNPVMLQLQSMGGLVQAPTTNGTPEGNRFEAVVGWSDQTRNNRLSPCFSVTRLGSFAASAVGGASAIAATSWEEPNQVQVFPPGAVGDPRNAYPPPYSLPQAPGASEAQRASTVLDRPIQFTATGAPVRLFVGQAPPVTNVVQMDNQGPGFGMPAFGSGTAVNGPLWGTDLGRRFVGLGATQVVAPFPGTHATATLRYLDGAAAARNGCKAVQQADLAAGGTVRLDDCSASNPLVSFLLESSKPVFAYPTGAPAATLAGVPAFLNATALAADFRGHLVRITTEDGQDPAARSTPTGVPATHKLLVTNLGRGINGAGLVDDITVSVLGLVGSDWGATLDGQGTSRSLVQMASGETRTVELAVTGKPSLPQGATSTLLVRAAVANTKVTDQVEIVTSIKSSYAVGLWFDVADNPTNLKKSPASPGAPADFLVMVGNRGTVPDTIRVTLRLVPDQSTWSATATLEDGSPLPPEGFRLPRYDPDHPELSLARLRLRIGTQEKQAPDASVFLLATSAGSSAATASRTAVAYIDSPADVKLALPISTLRVPPGANASFPIQASGLGSLTFRLASDAPAGWAPPLLLRRDSTGRVLAVPPSDAFSLTPGQALALEATLAVPKNESARRLAILHLIATPAGQGASQPPPLERFLYVVVAERHDVRVAAPASVGAPPGGGNLTLTLALANQGNLNETLHPRVADLPPQWRVALPELAAVARGGTAALPVTVTVPAGAPPGLYNVTLRLVSEDGNATTVPLHVQVGAVGQASPGGGPVVLAQPGGLARAAFPVRNQGNVPLAVRVAPAPGERWHLAGTPPPFLLLPGAAATVRFAWAVPRGEAEGNSTHHALLALAPQDPLAAPTQEPLTAQVWLGRSDLAPAAVRAFGGAAGTLVGVEVANHGSRAASGVLVQLRLGGAALDNVTLGELPAGATGNVTLLLPAGATGAAEVVLDPQDAIAERDEGNNAAAVPAPSGAAPAPIPPAAALLAVLAAVAAARRRRA